MAPGTVNEQPLNLRASLQEIWRRRLLIIIIAALCAVGGITYALLKPVDPTAVTLVLLPPDSVSSSTSSVSGNSGAGGNGLDTDAVIARSTPVLAAAGAKVTPPLGVLSMRKLVTVTPLSGQILQIEAQAPTGTYAVQLANAVAASYVDYIDQLETNSAGPGVVALQRESSQLTQQIKDLQTQIDAVSARISSEGAGSSAGQQDTTLLESLRNEQNQVALQLNNVSSQIASAELANGSTAGATRTLQKAALQPMSPYRLPVEAGIIGFAIGLLSGTVFVLIRFQRGHRLRLRDEIARAAGAPVIASIEAPTCTTSSAWRDFLQEPPRPTTKWALRHVLHSLQTGNGRRTAVRVITLAGDSPALATGPRLALHAAASGTPTALVREDPGESVDPSLASLRAAFAGAEPVGRGLPFATRSSDVVENPPQLVVSLVVFNGTFPPLVRATAVNLLSISPDFATADELADLALQAADHGLVLDGVVVVNPDPTDNTTGVMKNDTLRLVPSHTRLDGGDGELVPLGARASKSDWPGRFSSQES